MSISSKATILSRLASATEESPLALFETMDGIDCVFASTVGAQKRKASTSYIATVHKDMPLLNVEAVIRAHS